VHCPPATNPDEGLIDRMALFRKNYARKVAKANAKVAELTEASMQLQVRRSRAEAEIAQREAEKLRAENEVLKARYTALERGAKI
jgi:hypothetical protein